MRKAVPPLDNDLRSRSNVGGVALYLLEMQSRSEYENQNPGSPIIVGVCLLVTVNGSLPKVVHAETRMATGLTPEAVWEAIDAAKDGDTVQLPAGRAVWI